MGIISPLRNLVRNHVFALLATVLVVSTVHAQQSDPKTNLEDFVHYALVANAPMAEAHAQALLDNVSAQQLAELVDDLPDIRERLNRALDWGRRVPEMEDVVTQLAAHIETGRLELSHSPVRIKEAIGMLGGTRREQLLGQARLVAAGEYAVPALVNVIVDDATDERVRWNAEKIVAEIGREAVTPVSVALLNVGPEDQRRLIEIIDGIGYVHAAPVLARVASESDNAGNVREMAVRTLERMGVSADASPGELYSELARMYFDEREELIANPNDAVNNIWSWSDNGGLMSRSVPTKIYAPIMAMDASQTAMQYHPEDESALAIYVASNLRRENRLGGEADPYMGTLDYSPQFHATVHGPGIGQDVLILGMDSNDTPLVRDALQSLAATSGQGNLFGRYADREPLVEALQYPDRRVQVESALVLARALPDRPFAASNRVIPLLSSAVRTGGEEYAIVVAQSDEARQVAHQRLESLGFTVVGADRSVARLADAISQAPGIDLAYVQPGTLDGAGQTIDALRSTAGTVNTPVLFAVPTVDLPSYHEEFDRDVRVRMVRSGASDQAFESSVESLLSEASGGRMSEADAEIYAIESLDALKSIALTRPRAYNIVDAEPALIEAIADRGQVTRLMVAEILSKIDSETAQRALLDAALSSGAGDDRIPLLDYAAASVRRFGDYATDAQAAELAQMIKGASGEEADAAARLNGALNRTSSMMSGNSANQGS
ncbi:MAG: hypothetical protein CMJ39_01195 [Phycisphaerae bacterium]|nr:hypothetical protein [Phycisphaerae bacterium]|tara:strand:+ start:1149 stop:3317 length:2169 start_codon:yes stop_codon:yes gene_type:complete